MAILTIISAIIIIAISYGIGYNDGFKKYLNKPND